MSAPIKQRAPAPAIKVAAIDARDPVSFAPVGRNRLLPDLAEARKTYPIGTGFMDYFPDAVAEASHISYIGNQQHNPGQPLHWARGKSTDHADCIMRHFIGRGTLDSDGQRHSAKLLWRVAALLQQELEQELALPLSRGSTET